MLRRYRFRQTSVLAQAIDDTTGDHQITGAFLQNMGARHNIKEGGKDSWTMDQYWEGPPWRLRKGVKPGRI
jgi:hypothetical protein